MMQIMHDGFAVGDSNESRKKRAEAETRKLLMSQPPEDGIRSKYYGIR